MKIIELYQELHECYRNGLSNSDTVPIILKNNLLTHQLNIFMWRNPVFAASYKGWYVSLKPNTGKRLQFWVRCPQKVGNQHMSAFEIIKGKPTFTTPRFSVVFEYLSDSEALAAARLLKKYLAADVVPIKIDDSGLIVTILRE